MIRHAPPEWRPGKRRHWEPGPLLTKSWRPRARVSKVHGLQSCDRENTDILPSRPCWLGTRSANGQFANRNGMLSLAARLGKAPSRAGATRRAPLGFDGYSTDGNVCMMMPMAKMHMRLHNGALSALRLCKVFCTHRCFGSVPRMLPEPKIPVIIETTKCGFALTDAT